MPSVSVAMATYNGSRFLLEQLRSIAEQTVLPCELVIQDDLSSDNTLDIAEQFASAAPFPVHIDRNAERLGFIRNFRTAASRCTGDLIGFCDQDDWWVPQRLEQCIAPFADPDLLLLYHNAWTVDEERRRTGTLYDGGNELRLLQVTPFAPWHWSNGLLQIFRAGLREFDHLWDGSVCQVTGGTIAHDRWYFFLAQALGRVGYLDQPLVEYRQHRSNAFGASQIRLFRSPFMARIAHEGSQDARYAEAADFRARTIRTLAERVPHQAQRLRGIADKYGSLSQRHRRRHQAYCLSSFQERLASLVAGWRLGDYSGWPWGFDRRSILRDLWSGVIRATA